MPQDREVAHRISDIPRQWAARAPDNVAVYEGERTVSFAQLWQGIGRRAATWRRKGLAPAIA